ENQARMQAMIAAHGNLQRTEAALTREFQRVRQEDITDEILELSTART
ncbi:MAG: F0F1 ATP synthase subunit gamma, partial [Xanthomonadaceae bacterium]|nr:F0F1 ATP synthase subunit gamma [Xanthomonadaceae bacterium]